MRKVAFLVANDTFPEDPSIPPLRFTQNDAMDLEEVLSDAETCGFEPKLYLNENSQRILIDLERISGELAQDDTLLFYYSGHGRLRGNELCLVSKDTVTSSLVATSIPARQVLTYLQESRATRRLLILDCCHSGAIGRIYKGGDTDSALEGLAHGFGSYILTASTAIQLAEERERDGHGVFTKALIDCLREGRKESVTVGDWYSYAYDRLRIHANQTPLKWGLQLEGPSFEIGNFSQKLARMAKEERAQLISTARERLDALVPIGVLPKEEVDLWLHLLERDEKLLSLRNRQLRDDLVRFLKGDLKAWTVFGNRVITEQLPHPQVVPPATPPEPNRWGYEAVARTTSELLPGTEPWALFSRTPQGKFLRSSLLTIGSLASVFLIDLVHRASYKNSYLIDIITNLSFLLFFTIIFFLLTIVNFRKIEYRHNYQFFLLVLSIITGVTAGMLLYWMINGVSPYSVSVMDYFRKTPTQGTPSQGLF